VIFHRCARIDDELSFTADGLAWLRQLADARRGRVVTALTEFCGRSGFESSFQFRSAVLFGRFDCADGEGRYLETLTDTSSGGCRAEPSNRKNSQPPWSADADRDRQLVV